MLGVRPSTLNEMIRRLGITTAEETLAERVAAESSEPSEL